MATRKKKKTDVEQFDKQVVMKEEYYDLEPTVTKGNHLTVTTYPDGSTKLEWDDIALLKDVQEAIALVESVQTKPKKGKKK
jgi:hypothetical protein